MAESGIEKGKLFVGGLSWETKKEGLKKYFEQFGEVSDSVIMVDPISKKPRGFGFVTFADPDAVKVVMDNGPHVLDNKTIDPKQATVKTELKGGASTIKSKKVFVGGIPQSAEAEHIREVFGVYGVVTEVDLKFDRSTQKMRGFGFVGFESEDSVESACKDHFISVLGKQVEVKKAEPRNAVSAPDPPMAHSYPPGSYGGYGRGTAAGYAYPGYQSYYNQTQQQQQSYPAQYSYSAYGAHYSQSAGGYGSERSYYGGQQGTAGGQQQMGGYGNPRSNYGSSSIDSYGTGPTHGSYSYDGQAGTAAYQQYADSHASNYGQGARGVGAFQQSYNPN